MPEENKYTVEDGFMSKAEMIEGKYAIFVPHQSDFCLSFQKIEGNPYKGTDAYTKHKIEM